MTTSDPRTDRWDDDREQNYSATGNADGTGRADAVGTERTVAGGGDHPAATNIVADGLPGRAGPPDPDPGRDEPGYSATGNADGTGRADAGRTERTVTGGGAHPAADQIAADGLPGRADPPDGTRDDGPVDPDGPQGPRSGGRTR